MKTRMSNPISARKRKPTSKVVKSQPTRMVAPQAGPMQQGPMQQYQPTAPGMKKGGKVRRKKCCGGGRV